jgi:uncharacterized membrane protein
MKGTKGALIASTAAGLILGGLVLARADEQKSGGNMIHCAGVNACKGQGSCAGAGNSCAGMNSCKGKGVVDMSKEDCMKKGGKVVEPKS